MTLNVNISADNFINNPTLLDSDPSNFSADPYYNINAGLWKKALVFGATATTYQSTSKYPVNVFPMPCNFSSLH